MYIYIYIYICIHICICIYIYIYIDPWRLIMLSSSWTRARADWRRKHADVVSYELVARNNTFSFLIWLQKMSAYSVAPKNRGSKHNNIASRKTEVFFGECHVFIMHCFSSCLTRRSLSGPDGTSLRGALEAGGPTTLRSIFKLRISKFGVWVKQILT